MGIGWGDDAQAKFGQYRVESLTFTGRVKEELAYPVRGAMEDKKLRIPYKPEIRADLRAVTKVTTAAGNIRFTAERSENGHADRFWALALGIHASLSSSIASIGVTIDDNLRDTYRPEAMKGRRRTSLGHHDRFKELGIPEFQPIDSKHEIKEKVRAGVLITCSSEEYLANVRNNLHAIAGEFIDSGDGLRAQIALSEVK